MSTKTQMLETANIQRWLLKIRHRIRTRDRLTGPMLMEGQRKALAVALKERR